VEPAQYEIREVGTIVSHASCIELSESALCSNLRFLRRQLGPHVEIMSVVKANAYGHGLEVYVPLAERCGIRHFGVFAATEAERLLACKDPSSQVTIMGTIANEDLPWAVREGVAFYVFNRHRLSGAIRAARKIGRRARIHVELETGLHRTGFNPRSLPTLITTLLENAAHLEVVGTCTHFAGAESVGNHFRIQNQIQAFHRGVEQLREHGVEVGKRHAACSAAALNYPETVMDLVRVGIAQYGYWPSLESKMSYLKQFGRGRRTSPLRRVLKWRSVVMDVKSVAAGEFVGYGNHFQTTRRTRLASVPVGYYHGFARDLSNLGHVLIRGERCRVIGVVNMNMLMADITDNRLARIGDEVVLIGSQGEQEITVGTFGELSNDLNYEVLVRLPQEIPRVVAAPIAIR
jgi:alanine racemase